MGIGVLIFFTLLRYTNIYGDPHPWSAGKNVLYTFMSFINVEKYPPSLLFLSVTIGVALIALAVFANVNNRFSRILITYGRVPMFFYIVHFYILSGLNVTLFLSRGHSLAEGIKGIPNIPFKFLVSGEGYSLWTVYMIWILVVITLYPLCRWYEKYRMTHPEKKWLSYI